MNPTITAMLKRRSVRAYQKKQVPEAELTAIIEAGLHAATARNKQPWFFTVVQKQALIEKVTEAAKETMRQSAPDASYLERINSPDYTVFFHAPTVIIVSGQQGEHYATTDCANAVQNMSVAAHSLGLGSCYIASFQRAFHDPKVAAALKNELGIPEDYTPTYALALGYTAGDPPAPVPRKQDVVHYIREA